MDTTRTITGAKAGWRYDEFSSLVGLSRSTLYGLAPELRPRSIKVRTSTVIIEPPAEYLKRLAAMLDEAA